MLKRSIPCLAGLPVFSLFDIPIDENGFVDWLIDAEPGARLIYYRGHLAHDRMASTDVHDPLHRVRLNRLSSRVDTSLPRTSTLQATDVVAIASATIWTGRNIAMFNLCFPT